MKAYFFLLSFSLLLMSCTGSKKSTEADSSKNNSSTNSMKSRLISHDHDFNYYAGSGTAEIKDPSLEISASFNYRIKKDSIIWLSGSKFGFEAIRALITPDSAFVLSRLDQMYYKVSVNDLPIPFDFSMLQDYLAGRSFYDGKSTLILESDDPYYTLSNGLELDKERRYELDKASMTLMRILIPSYPFENDQYALDLSYADYKQIDDNKFAPFVRNLTIVGSDGSQRALNLSLKKINTDENLTFPFSVNPKYEIGTFE